MKLYMFRTVRLSIIRSLFTVHSAIVYVIHVCRQLSSRSICHSATVYVIQVCRQLSSRSICSCSKAVYKPVWHTLLLSVQWINSWWWADELSETFRDSWQNKFVKLVNLIGFCYKETASWIEHPWMNTTRCANREKLASQYYITTEHGEAAWGHPVLITREEEEAGL